MRGEDQVNIPTPQKKQPPKTKALLGLKSILFTTNSCFILFTTNSCLHHFIRVFLSNSLNNNSQKKPSRYNENIHNQQVTFLMGYFFLSLTSVLVLTENKHIETKEIKE